MSDNCTREGEFHMYSDRCYEAGRREVIKRAEAAEAALKRVRAVLADGPDTWTPYESRDTGWTFLQESVADFTADLRAALDGDR